MSAPIAASPAEYVCPGERYAISQVVHLARLDAGYAACRDCVLREGLRISPAADQEADASRSPLRRLFMADGVRGVSRNEVDEPLAERLAAALATMLWEDSQAAGEKPPAAGFPVVIGYDDRPWSPGLAAAAGMALRRYGCETIDVGLVTGPAFRFAVAHLDAAAGMLATGAGGGPAIAGLDFAWAGGRPLSAGGSLDRLAGFAERTPGRMTRRGGGRREFDVALPYEAGLRKHFRPVASVTGVVGTASSLVRRRIERLASEIPATLRLLSLPRVAPDRTGTSAVAFAQITGRGPASTFPGGGWGRRGGDVEVQTGATASPPVDSRSTGGGPASASHAFDAEGGSSPATHFKGHHHGIAKAIGEERAAFGLWIDDDGTVCRAFAETGQAVPVADLAGLLIADAVAERPATAIVADWPLAERLGGTDLRREEMIRGNGTAEAMFVSVRDQGSAVGADSAGRFWLAGPPPVCDALVTLARLLRMLGAGGEPLSRRIASGDFGL